VLIAISAKFKRFIDTPRRNTKRILSKAINIIDKIAELPKLEKCTANELTNFDWGGEVPEFAIWSQSF
jgi:hypothetical protein